jgi:predicted negative regulator of RcsB-dependent stress response
VADDPTEEEDLTLEAQEAGFAFKAEMWATDAFLRYWPYVVGSIAVVLACIFFYGQYTSYQDSQQRAYAKAVTMVENKLENPVEQLSYLQATGQELDAARLIESAQALEAIGATGPGLCEAMLKAAEIYRIAGKPEDQRRALEAVVSTGISPYDHVAGAALANLDLEAGANDAAIERLTVLSQDPTYLGEQAALDLGLIHEQLGQTAEARTVYAQFLEKRTDSPRLDLVQKRLDALSAG